MYRDRMAAGYDEADVMRSIHAKSRDNARTPMQWDTSANAGFTTGTPWMQVNPNYAIINAADEAADGSSVFHYYQTLIRLRKQYPIFSEGDFTLLFADHPALFAYQRRLGAQVMTVLCNFYEEPLTLPAAQVSALPLDTLLLGNYDAPADAAHFRPYEARIYLSKAE